jgi:hypothetical protein
MNANFLYLLLPEDVTHQLSFSHLIVSQYRLFPSYHIFFEDIFTTISFPSPYVKNSSYPSYHKTLLILDMATTVSYAPGRKSRFVKTRRGYTGNHHLAADVKSSKYLNVSYDAASISTTASLLRDGPDCDTFSTPPKVSPATKVLGKFKDRIQSHIEARNSRANLYDACQRDLRIYVTQTNPTVNVYPPHVAHVTHATMTCTTENNPQHQKDYPAYKAASLSSSRSGTDIMESKVGDLKNRVMWRLACITDYGVEEGMRVPYPAYSKAE